MSSSPKTQVIDGDTLEFSEWALPSIQIPTEKERAENERLNIMTAESIEALQKKAYQEGHEQGMQQGLADGAESIRKSVARLEGVFNTLHEPLKELDEAVVEQMVALAISVARQIIRREIKTDPSQIIAAVREAIAVLPVGSRQLQVYLNPADALIVKEAMAISPDDHRWKIIDDPTLTQGGCKVVTEKSSIDASIEERITRIMTGVLGGERRSDNNDES